MGKDREPGEDVHDCTQENHPDRKVDNQDVKAADKIHDAAAITFAVPIGKPHDGEENQPEDSKEKGQFDTFRLGFLMFHKSAHT